MSTIIPQQPKKKQHYRVRTWKEYNAALVNRGSLEVWIDTDVIAQWYAPPQGKNGAPHKYSDTCIQTCLTLRALYTRRLRTTEGFVRSVLKLMGVERDTPDHTTIARRSETCTVSIRVRETPDHVELYADSTGGKVSGEGEWKVRKHGAGKRRQWVKIHLGITPEGDILSCVVTENDVHDSEVIEELLDIETVIDAFGGDGAYDTRRVYDALEQRHITDVRIPPQKNAKIWQHGNCKSAPHPRDRNLRAIRKSTRAAWKRDCGYHVRSNAETAMFRFKTTFSDRISSRRFARQETEVRIKVRALNVMTGLGPTGLSSAPVDGMPESYAVPA
jgi:hypothetical protein